MILYYFSYLTGFLGIKYFFIYLQKKFANRIFLCYNSIGVL